MSPFWTSLFSNLKADRRSTTLFMITLAGMFMLIVLVTALCANNLQDYVIRALPGVGVFMGVWIALTIRRARARRRERLGYPRLSFDELSKARSKLVKARRGQ
jgi:uncharacterized membrane protein YhaH (DUF805 family)